MEIEYEKPRHERLANDFNALGRKYGSLAEDIIAAMDVLRAANTLADVPGSYRPHPLKGKAKGLFTINVDDVHRVVFRPNFNVGCNVRIDTPKSISGIIIADICFKAH